MDADEDPAPAQVGTGRRGQRADAQVHGRRPRLAQALPGSEPDAGGPHATRELTRGAPPVRHRLTIVLMAVLTAGLIPAASLRAQPPGGQPPLQGGVSTTGPKPAAPKTFEELP